MTLYRRRLEYRMLELNTSNVTDNELVVLIREIQRESPGLGESRGIEPQGLGLGGETLR